MSNFSDSIQSVPDYKRSITVYASAARTATPTVVDINSPCGRGIHVIISVTASASTPSVVCTVNGVSKSGISYNILTSAAFTGGAEVRRLKIHPNAAAAANLAVADFVPNTYNVTMTHADADSITYSVDVEELS